MRRVADGAAAASGVFFQSLLLLHAAVLEPDLDLGLVEAEGRGDLYPAGPREVLIEVELLLQLRQLLVREVCPAHVRLSSESVLATLAWMNNIVRFDQL